MPEANHGFIEENTMKRIGRLLRRMESTPPRDEPVEDGPQHPPYYVEFLGKLNGTLHSSATTTGAEASIWVPGSTGPADTTRDETVFPWFLEAGEALPPETKVTVGSFGGKLIVTHPSAGFETARFFAPTSGTRVVPKFGVFPMRHSDSSGVWRVDGLYKLGHPTVPQTVAKDFGINVGEDVSIDSTGDSETRTITRADGTFSYALVSTDAHAISLDDRQVAFGILPSSNELKDDSQHYTLFPFLPGFRAVGIRRDVDGSDVIPVKPASLGQTYWAMAKDSWQTGGSEDYVDCWPCSAPAAGSGIPVHIYDGVSVASVPEIVIRVAIHRQTAHSTKGPEFRDPNVQPGNMIKYMRVDGPVGTPDKTVEVAMDVWDDAVGTVKLMSGAGHSGIRQGWRQLHSTGNPFLRAAASALAAGTSGTFGFSSGADFNNVQYVVIERFE